MNVAGIRQGDEIEVSIHTNGELTGVVVLTALSVDEVSAEILTEDGGELLTMFEALKAAASCVDYHLHSPRLKEMLEDRIKEIKSWIAEGKEGEPPSPTTNDLPS